MKTILTVFKNLFKYFINYYVNIAKLYTGYKISNLVILLGILTMGIVSVFIRPNILLKLNNYPIIINLLLLIGMIYITFLQFNLFLRLTLIIFKGLPYFYKEIKIGKPFIKKYLLGYLVYNLFLILISYLVLFRLYLVINNYNEELSYLIGIYSVVTSYVLFRSYLESNYSDYNYTLDPNKIYNLGLLQLILLFVLPFVLLVNVYPVINSYFNYLIFSNTIYCEPVGSDGNTNTQVIDNVQESTKDNSDNSSKNLNIQGIKNTQLTAGNNNDNNQTISNQQVDSPLLPDPLRGAKGAVKGDSAPLIVNNPPGALILPNAQDILIQLYQEIITDKFIKDSFWNNISFLEKLKSEDLFPIDYLESRINLIIGEARYQSKFNEYIFINHPNAYFHDILFNNKMYARFIDYPVYFNNCYEICNFSSNSYSFDLIKIYSVKDTCYSMLDLYYYILNDNNISYDTKNFIINQVKTTIKYSHSNSKIANNAIDYDHMQARLYNVFYKHILDYTNTAEIQYYKLGPLKLFYLNKDIEIENNRFYALDIQAVDSKDQLKYLINKEYNKLQIEWIKFVNRPDVKMIINEHVGLYSEYQSTFRLEFNDLNLKTLITYSDRDSLIRFSRKNLNQINNNNIFSTAHSNNMKAILHSFIEKREIFNAYSNYVKYNKF